MTFTKVLHADTGPTDVTLHLLGDDGKRYALTFPAAVTGEVMAHLVQASTRLQGSSPAFQHGPLYTVTGCQPIAADGRREGVVLILREGFELPLILDRTARAGLRACIDQLDAGPFDDQAQH